MSGRRMNYYPQPWRKHMVAYSNFGSGLNTVTSNDNLADSELRSLYNMDLGERGSLRPRKGSVSDREFTNPVTSFFQYVAEDGTPTDFYVSDGKLYRDDETTPMQVGGADASLLSDRYVEAAQLGDTMYIATGNGLLSYNVDDGLVKVEPYAPNALELLYIGTNALDENPDSGFSDSEGSTLMINGVSVSKQYGVVNEPTTFDAFITKPSAMTVEYQFDYRLRGAETWKVGQAWGASDVWTFTPTEVNEYEINVRVRDSGDTDNEMQYIFPIYKVNETDENTPRDIKAFEKINECNRILVHWERLVLYSDDPNHDTVFVSHLRQGDYFPFANTFSLIDQYQDSVVRLVQYRDVMVAFTPNQIYAIFGIAPNEYEFPRINTAIGCIAPNSVDVMGNYVVFLAESGIHILKSVSYTENRLNVEKIDRAIENDIQEQNERHLAVGAVYENQYCIGFPSGIMYRYYYTQGNVWTRDRSEYFSFHNLRIRKDGQLVGMTRTSPGHLLVLNQETDYDIDKIVEAEVEFKSYDFGEPYNPKKLKNAQFLIGGADQNTRLQVYVYADDALVFSPNDDYADVDDAGETIWVENTDPNIILDGGTRLGTWELGVNALGQVDSKVYTAMLSGKCRRVRIVVQRVHEGNFRILGMGFVFKTKKPKGVF